MEEFVFPPLAMVYLMPANLVALSGELNGKLRVAAHGTYVSALSPARMSWWCMQCQCLCTQPSPHVMVIYAVSVSLHSKEVVVLETRHRYARLVE